MTRARVAVALAVLASLAVVATVVVAVVTRAGGDGGTPGPTPGQTSGPATGSAPTGTTVTDRRSGARFTVSAEGWSVRGPRTRIYYADDHGRPVAAVRGPAVFRPGYCAAHPRGSSRAFAGFTGQGYAAWVGALGGAATETAYDVDLVGGQRAHVRRARVRPDTSGPCAVAEAEVAMATVGDVRLVLVADAGALTDDEIEAVLGSLDLP